MYIYISYAHTQRISLRKHKKAVAVGSVNSEDESDNSKFLPTPGL